MPLPKMKKGDPNMPMRGKKKASVKNMNAAKPKSNKRAKKAVKAAYGSYAG